MLSAFQRAGTVFLSLPFAECIILAKKKEGPGQVGNATSLCLKYYFTLFCNASPTDLAAEYIVNVFSKSKMEFFIFIHLTKINK